MTKEGLKQKAREWTRKTDNQLNEKKTHFLSETEYAEKAYIAGAIEATRELEEKLEKETTQRIYNFNKSIEWKEKHRKLQERIEKMINEIDKTMVLSNMRECEICDIQDIFRKYGFKRNSNGTWEIK